MKKKNRHRCYICLEGDGDGKSAKLMRGCACRGDSAGFVHLECLTELAKSKEASSDDSKAIADSWTTCGNCKQKCKQEFTGALWVEMFRRFWRYHRSGQDGALRYGSLKFLALCLREHGEVDATNQLLAEANAFAGNLEDLPDVTMQRIEMLKRNGQNIDVLELLQATLPEAKESTGHSTLYGYVMQEMARVFLRLGRYQEAHEAATELVAYNKAKYGAEDPQTLIAMAVYAIACAGVGRMDESKASFDDAVTTQIRVLGRDHPDTQETRRLMDRVGFTVSSSG